MKDEQNFFDALDINDPAPGIPLNASDSSWAHDPDHPLNVDGIDSGKALLELQKKYTARINQLKSEISLYRKEADHVVDENLYQNLELITLNKNLEIKVKERTYELEKANEKLRDLNQVKESLMHMIVHDMKNPLTAMLGTLILFTRNNFGVKEEMHQLLVDSHAHGIKLLSMIDQILMISRMQTNEFKLKHEYKDIIPLICESIDMMSKTTGDNVKNLTFTFLPQEEPLQVYMDGQTIERVMNNLLNNAIKYAPKNSEIHVSLMQTEASAVITITNWGDPIPEHYQDRIFELFCRVKKEDTQFSGTGLGLTFCKLAVEAHGGTIFVTSPVAPKDHGARFTFSIPLDPVKACE